MSDYEAKATVPCSMLIGGAISGSPVEPSVLVAVLGTPRSIKDLAPWLLHGKSCNAGMAPAVPILSKRKEKDVS